METKYEVNRDSLGELSMDILDYADRISELFNDIYSKFISLEDYYKGDTFDALKVKIVAANSNFEKIKNNIVSYADDLIMVTKKATEDSSYISTLVNALADSIKEKSKNIID